MTERKTYNFRSLVKPLEKEPGIKDHNENKILSAAGKPMEISKEFRTVSQEATGSTLEDTKITWHECCKGSEKRTMVRQVMSKAIKCGDNLDQKGFVTEARLEQFGKELQEQCANAVTKAIRENNASHAGRRYDFKPRRQTFHNVECFECKEVGHFARNCPQRRPNQPVSQRNDFLRQRRNQNSSDLY